MAFEPLKGKLWYMIILFLVSTLSNLTWHELCSTLAGYAGLMVWRGGGSVMQAVEKKNGSINLDMVINNVYQ